MCADELDNKTYLRTYEKCGRCGVDISDTDYAEYNNIEKNGILIDSHKVCEHCEILIDTWIKRGNKNKSFEY
jgi:hypothetical protein